MLRQQLRRRRDEVGAVRRERGGHEVIVPDAAVDARPRELPPSRVADRGGDVPDEDPLDGGAPPRHHRVQAVQHAVLLQRILAAADPGQPAVAQEAVDGALHLLRQPPVTRRPAPHQVLPRVLLPRRSPNPSARELPQRRRRHSWAAGAADRPPPTAPALGRRRPPPTPPAANAARPPTPPALGRRRPPSAADRPPSADAAAHPVDAVGAAAAPPMSSLRVQCVLLLLIQCVSSNACWCSSKKVG